MNVCIKYNVGWFHNNVIRVAYRIFGGGGVGGVEIVYVFEVELAALTWLG